MATSVKASDVLRLEEVSATTRQGKEKSSGIAVPRGSNWVRILIDRADIEAKYSPKESIEVVIEVDHQDGLEPDFMRVALAGGVRFNLRGEHIQESFVCVSMRKSDSDSRIIRVATDCAKPVSLSYKLDVATISLEDQKEVLAGAKVEL